MPKVTVRGKVQHLPYTKAGYAAAAKIKKAGTSMRKGVGAAMKKAKTMTTRAGMVINKKGKR